MLQIQIILKNKYCKLKDQCLASSSISDNLYLNLPHVTIDRPSRGDIFLFYIKLTYYHCCQDWGKYPIPNFRNIQFQCEWYHHRLVYNISRCRHQLSKVTCMSLSQHSWSRWRMLSQQTRDGQFVPVASVTVSQCACVACYISIYCQSATKLATPVSMDGPSFLPKMHHGCLNGAWITSMHPQCMHPLWIAWLMSVEPTQSVARGCVH